MCRVIPSSLPPAHHTNREEEKRASEAQDQVKPPIPSDGSLEPFIGDEDVPGDEEDQHEGEIRPARVFREEWLENETDQYERDDEHQ